jgi:hypothetical protein
MLKTSSKGKPLSEWGKAVKLALFQKGMDQCDLIPLLEAQGYKVSPAILSKMLYGYFVETRNGERNVINGILKI